MIVAGIGCRKGATTESILDAIEAAAEASRTQIKDVVLLVTMDDKVGEAGMIEAAKRLRLPLHAFDLAVLRAEDRRVVTRSPITLARYGIGSIAEAAALAAVGQHGQLLTARFMNDQAACALAWKEDE
ncbi:cobalamin biosynthesis protein [Lacibacterium aquatile]|uniref:Cobalamin biosynthesis protein n=1 Tax=Lacibacterium aquatile TaxID=1168082 RepID=A0ABW5DS33_9PROT